MKGFIIGIARLFDFSSSINHKLPMPSIDYRCEDMSGWNKDGVALAGDWKKVGNDIQKAMLSMRGEYEQKLAEKQ